MDSIIYSLAKKLNKAITNNADYIKLNELDKMLNENEEVMRLSYLKDVACVKYSDLLKIYDDNNPKVKEALKELNIAKKNLDLHPLVKEYLLYYSKVKQTYFEMNKILFEDYKSSRCD